MGLVRISLAMTLVLAACAADTQPEAEAEAEPQSDALQSISDDWCSLDGTWRTMCNPGQTGGVAREVTFACGLMTYLQYEYADSNCNVLANVVSFEASFQIGQVLDEQSGVRELDAHVFDASITPLDSAIASRMNQVGVCDRTDWSVGRSRSLTRCDSVPGAPGSTVYAAVARDGDELVLAEGSAGPALTLASTPAQRPSHFRRDSYITYRLK